MRIIETSSSERSSSQYRHPSHARSYARGATAATLVLALAGLATACSSNNNSSNAATANGGSNSVTAKLSIVQANGTAQVETALKFADLVDKYTDGRVKIKIYPNSILGSATSTNQGCEQGTIQFCASAGLSSVVPSLSASNAPYLFSSDAQEQAVLNSPALKAIWAKAFAAAHLTYLGQWGLSPSVLMTTSKQVETPADMKGLRIRVGTPYPRNLVYSSVGADPVQVATTEVQSALSTNEINGVDDPITSIIGSGWVSSMHYMSILNDYDPSDPIVASSAFMKTLSAADRAAIQRAFTDTLASAVKLNNSSEAAGLRQLEAQGIHVTRPSTAPFRVAFQKLLPKIEKMYPAVMQAIEKALSTTSPSGSTVS